MPGIAGDKRRCQTPAGGGSADAVQARSCSETEPSCRARWASLARFWFCGSSPSWNLTDTQRKVLIALCRPFRDGNLAIPASNQAIAAELYLSVDAVKMHLRALFVKFQLGQLPQNQKRAKLAQRALQLGSVSLQDLA